MANKVETVEVPFSKLGLHWPIIFMTFGSVLCTSKNVGVKAFGASLTMGCFMLLIDKLANLPD